MREACPSMATSASWAILRASVPTDFQATAETPSSYVTGGATYADILPSLNLIFKPTPQDFIRLFLGRQEMRPTMYQMRAARDYGYNAANALSTVNSPWSGTSGNPDIRPWLSDSADLSLEHYFAHGGGYVRLGVFEKKLLTYIYQQNTVTNFAGYPYTSVTPPILTQGITSEYVNGQGGNISGLEADFELTSDVMTGGVVKGFGVQLNGLLVDSSIKPWGPNNPSSPLPDMSKKTANATLYYESHGFSARVTEHYQSETREYIVQFGPPSFSSLGTPGDGYSGGDSLSFSDRCPADLRVQVRSTQRADLLPGGQKPEQRSPDHLQQRRSAPAGKLAEIRRILSNGRFLQILTVSRQGRLG